MGLVTLSPYNASALVLRQVRAGRTECAGSFHRCLCLPQRAVLALRQRHDDPDRAAEAAGDAAARVLPDARCHTTHSHESGRDM